MNGHLQLSISLKNPDEIQAAIELLKSLLPSAMPKKDFDEYHNEYLASKAASESASDWIKTPKFIESEASPSKYGKLGMKELANDSKKLLERRGIINKPPTVTKEQVQDAFRAKQRKRALKRKRDKSGHFVK